MGNDREETAKGAGAEAGRDAGTGTETDVENILKILDGFAAGGESRMKLDVSGEIRSGSVSKVRHHGRCDVGSPWATGDCFDAEEGVCDIG